MPGTRFVNLRSKNLVEVFNEGPATITIATVTGDGYGRRRQVPADSFHDNYLARNGQPHATGYVPVNSLPGNHPHAMKTEMTRMELLDSLDKFSNAELADLILRQEQIASEADTLAKQAKAVLKGRRKDAGLEVHGDITLVFSGSGEAFDAATAVKNLAPADLKRICVLKPDAKKAREALKGDPAKLKLCMKEAALSLKVRPTTDEDRLQVLSQSVPADGDAGGIEIFELDEPPF